MLTTTEKTQEPYMENKKRTGEVLTATTTTTEEEAGPLMSSIGAAENPQHEMLALWEHQRQKDAQNLVLQKKLSHYRSWISSLQDRVLLQNPQAVKNAKRLYISGFSHRTSEEDLRFFLSELLQKTGGCSMPGNPIISVRIMRDKNFAFAEFRSVEETVNATALDGVAFEGSTRLKIRRPSNYDIHSAVLLGPLTPDPTMNATGLDICRSTVDDSPHKLFIGGLPYEYNEDRVREMVGNYAAVRSFNLVMDRTTGKSKGYAFCELVDEEKTDFVIQQLNSQKVENKLLTVKRAMEGSRNTNSVLLQAMMSPAVTNNGGGGGGSGVSFPADLTPPPPPPPHHHYSSHHPYGLNSSNQPMMAPQRPYTVLGLTGMHTAVGAEGLIGSTPLSNSSLQANNMMSRLAPNGGQRPSSLISQMSSLTNGSTVDALPGSYRSFSIGGNSNYGFDLKVDPELLGHDLSQSIGAAGNNACLYSDKGLTDQLELHGIENPGGNSLW